MNTEQILNMIDELRELGMVKFGITGGEPLLREDIGEIIDHAQQKGVIVTLNTNGSFVPKRIEDLLGLHTLIVSIDGLEKTHEINRLRGSFASAMQAIKTARDRALNVWSLTVISKDNVSELDELIDLMRSMRVRMLFQPVEEWDIHSDAVSESLPSKQEFRRTIDKLISLKKKDKIIATSMSYLKLLHSWPIYPGFARCDVGRFSCNIMPNGDVISCTVVQTTNPPNGLKIGFGDAFMSLDTPNCKGCFMNCYHEPNFIIQLKPDAILNTIKFLR